MDFKAKYNRQSFLNFFQNEFLPEDLVRVDEKIDFKPDRLRSAMKIAEVPSLDLTILEIEHESENDPRVSLSRETFRLLANYGKQRALVLFISKTSANYRLSLVTIDLKLEGAKVTKEYSNPKRFSFFLGPDAKTHTPEAYLAKRVTDFEDLKKRFSIEVVNKEFYSKIAELFTTLAGGKRGTGKNVLDAGKGLLKFVAPDETVRKNFAVRLIGRLIFCWFLKKKKPEKGQPLLPEELLSSQAIEQTKNYYHKSLEPLFFEVLNTPVEGRKEKYKSGAWTQIPFLNGGLFTPHEDDYYKLTFMGESEYINTLDVPDKWLKELLSIFETYNFTIDENTPVDIELAIEPEMLGRIFENLLAEINPETGETARKATGSYYTPRPIVEYMVDESLKQYLLQILLKNSPPDSGGAPEGGGGKIMNLPEFKTFRKELRNNLTPAEAKLWSMLQGKKLEGRKFRRQHSVDKYVLDFYCPEEKLAVELDGHGHFTKSGAEYDKERDLFISTFGIKVLRFENKLVWDNPEGLLEEIKNNFGWSK